MISVIVASLGRPENLATLLSRLSAQTNLPSQVILSMETEADAPPEADYPFPVERVFGPRGSSVQRNRGLDRLAPGTDIVVFYDDDFVPSRFALAGIARFFAGNGDVAGAKGLVIFDGIDGPGITTSDAVEMVRRSDEGGEPQEGRIISDIHGLYGCNMAYRIASIAGLRFDENLPLYGWFEDIDFGARVPGRLVHTDAFQGVHCGEKRGREKNGRRLGYSQVANPVYMVRKGTMEWRFALNAILRRMAMNHVRVLRPEPWIDRRGRTIGNWIAIVDLIMGRSRPDRILDI